FTLDTNGLAGVSAADRDKKIDLSGLSDNVWEAGSTAVFTLTVSGGADSTNLTTNGGHETLIDNIGITIVPEPTSLALLGLGSLLIARRRR
ncbi:MAG: PEP-CTERM sorting domain-containing protein, partial [Phycisphaeraceae bacterium]